MFDALHTERLLLRPYSPEDARARWEATEESRGHLRRFEPEQADSCRTVSECQNWIEQANARWQRGERFAIGMWTRTNQYLGGIGLHPCEPHGRKVPAFGLGYWVRASAQGQGYVTEGVGRIVSYCFEDLLAERVEIRCDATNERSAAVAVRLGFELEGRLRRVERIEDGTLVDELVFARIRHE